MTLISSNRQSKRVKSTISEDFFHYKKVRPSVVHRPSLQPALYTNAWHKTETHTFILSTDSLCVCDLESFLMISTPLTGPELASFGGGRLHATSSNIVCSLTVA